MAGVVPGSAGGGDRAPRTGVGLEPVYPRAQPPAQLEPNTNAGVVSVGRVSPLHAAAASGLVAALLGLGLGYLLWGGDQDRTASTTAAGDHVAKPTGDTPAATTEVDLPDEGSKPATNHGADDAADDGAGNPEAASAEVRPAQPCQVVVQSKPEGVQLNVAGKSVGATPYDGPAPCGDVELTATKVHYMDETKSATLVAGTPGQIDFDLNRMRYMLTVASSPAGATVKINGKSAGTSPARKRFPAFFKANVSVSKRGYKSWSTMVRLKKDTRLTATLERASRSRTKPKPRSTKTRSKSKKR